MSTLSSIQPYSKLPFSGVLLPEITISKSLREAAGASETCSNAEFLKQLCRQGFKIKCSTLTGEKRKEYGDRVKMELETIEELGFVAYILLVWDICRFADEKGIPRGIGRGSVGGSLVSYLIDITGLDPIENGLFFSRFLSKARAKKVVVDGVTYIDGSLVPDIDCDFSYYRRGEIIEYINTRYPGQTSKLLTTTTFTSKILIKDVLKIFEGVDEETAKAASDLIDKKHGVPIELEDGLYGDSKWKSGNTKDGSPPDAKLVEWAADHEETLDIAMGLSGLNRAEGQHASAVLICHKPIADLMPLQLSSEHDGVKDMVSGFDMYSAQEIIVKMDVLGLRTADVINEACKLIGIDWKKINVHDDSIYLALQDFRLRYGIFQLETYAQGGAAAKIKPKNFEQLTAVLAIARPQAFAYLDQYNKYVSEGVYNSVHPLIDDVLKPTGGVCLYQEQYLAMLVKIGMTAERAENARRVLGKKKVEEVPAVKAEIEEICKRNNHPPEIVDLLLKIAEESGGYGFNLSHAASYAMITAYTLFLKAKYPLQFYWALLRMSRHEANGHEVISQIEKEMRAQGFKLLPPQLDTSMDFSIEGTDSIRFALNMVRGISDKNQTKLESFIGAGGIKSNANKFEAFQAIKNAGLHIGVVCSLIQAGCLSAHGSSRSRLVLECSTWNLLSDSEKSLCLTIGSKESINWDVLNAIIYLRDNLDERGKPLMKATRFQTIKKRYEGYKEIYELNRRNERLANFWYEKTVLGYSYSETLRGIFGEKLDGLVSVAQAREMKAGETVRLIGFVKEPESGKTKAGNKSFRFTLSDETEEVRVMLFNDKIGRMEECNGRLSVDGDILITRGKVMEGGTIFGDECGIQTSKIFMRLSELKDEAAKKAEKLEAATP